MRSLRHKPLVVLCLGIGAFVAWVSSDLFQHTREIPPAPTGDLVMVEITPPILTPRDPEKAKPTPSETAQVLPKLKPGMTRTEVEGLVGSPEPDDIHPATITGQRVTYRTAYEADFEPPATIRPLKPIAPMGRTIAEPKPPRTLVTLEFDATKPGHPLVEVYYPDPLF